MIVNTKDDLAAGRGAGDVRNSPFAPPATDREGTVADSC
jgi:hypothetical protein